MKKLAIPDRVRVAAITADKAGLGAVAFGALAVGAFAIGALAIGALAIRRLFANSRFSVRHFGRRMPTSRSNANSSTRS